MDFEKLVEQACKPGPKRSLPGAVLAAAGRSGNAYIKAFGTTAVEESAQPLKADAVMWIASCTKLITTICVLQCVEKGLLDLDADATELLPELKGLPVFVDNDSMNGEKLEMEPRKNMITLRLLMSHQSGSTYEMFSPKLMSWRRTVDAPKHPFGSVDGHLIPFLFQPGTSWAYSGGLDFAGRMVERVNNMSLGDYMQHNIFDPLGMHDTTMELSSRPDLKRREMPRTDRELRPKGSPPAPLKTAPPIRPEKPVDHAGGGGLWSTAGDYLKLLTSILKDDEKLLKSSSRKLLFDPQMSDPTNLIKTIYHPYFRYVAVPGYPLLKWNASLGGILLMENCPGRHHKGALSWGGMPNLIWWIDPSAGVCGIFATSLTPPGEPRTIGVKQAFQEEIFRRWGETKTSL